MNYKYKHNKYEYKLYNLIGGNIFNENVIIKINKMIDDVNYIKKDLKSDSVTIHKTIYDDETFLILKYNISQLYFQLYNNSIVRYKSDDDITNLIEVSQNELLSKTTTIEKINKDKKDIDLLSDEYNNVILNQIYLGLFYLNNDIKTKLNLIDLSELNVFTRTIVEIVLNKYKI